ncbi:MAG: serine/threonine protein kinase [Planctomycetes bacterium]|nr:serine/threonine protein kinase [Planctomycetota bacterium]
MGEITSEDRAFARLALKNEFLTREQVKECFRQLRNEESGLSRFEDIAVQTRYLTNDQATAVGVAYRRLKKDSEKKRWSIKGYEIYGKLGEGGLGVVLKAKQTSMNRLVALKILHKRWLDDEEFKQRFLVEARLVGKLSHQNLIKVYDVGREEWKLYFSMEYVEGETVEQVIEREGALGLEDAIDLTIQILRAIKYISRFDIVHCDIKPSNIMLTSDNVAKLGDFGFVKSNIEVEVTEEGSVLGTPDYIAPEQAMGKDVDWRSDLYSLGITLYHMLAKRPPFDGTVSTIMRSHIRDDLPNLRDVNPQVPQAMVGVLAKMTAKNPNDRYQDIGQVFEALEAIKLKEKGKSGGVDSLRTNELKELLKLEKEKSRDRQREALEFKTQLNRMTKLFWGVAAVAAIAVVICLVLAIKVGG